MRRSFLLVCALIVSGAMGAGAKEREGSFSSPRMLPDSIVVTVNRFGLSDSRSVWPSTVIRLNQGSSAVSLDSRLDGDAGVDIRNYNGAGSVATLSNWGVFNRHMLLLYNGRAVKDYSLGGFNLADYSPNEFERIEIVKGPQSAFYGSDAVGGVVNLITRSALANRIEARTKAGSFGTQSYFVDASRRMGIFGLEAWTEYATADNRRDNAGMDRFLAGVRSEMLSGTHRFTLSARYFTDSLGVPGPVPEPAYVPIYGSREASSLTAHQEDQNYSVDMQYRLFHESMGEAQVDVFWEKKNLDYRSLYNYPSYFENIDSSVVPWDTTASVDSVDVHSHTAYIKRSAGINARYLRTVGAFAFAGGIDWLSGSLRAGNTDLGDGTNILGPGAPYSYEYESFSYWAASQNQFDVWGNTRWEVGAPVHLDLSGRLQFVRNRRVQPSYNLGIVAEPDRSVRVKVGYAYAFRLPTIAEQFADDVFTAGNARLNPETARTIAATLAVEPEDFPVSGRVTYFRQQVDSLIQYRWDPTIFRSVPRNFERFESSGLDFSMMVQVRHNVRVVWSGVWQAAEQSSGNGGSMQAAAYVPDLKWRAGMEWARGRVDGGADLTFTSERSIFLYDGSRKAIERVYELGMHGGVKAGAHIQVSVIGYDLTDERRADQFGFTSADGDYPGLGRRFFLEVAVTM